MLKVGIVGSSGYVAGELIRLLVNHPKVKVEFLYSHSNASAKASSIHKDLFAYEELEFTDKISTNIEVLFLCLGHGNSIAFLEKHSFSKTTKIIDLSADFRLKSKNQFKEHTFKYSIPEIHSSSLKRTDSIANPGCFATAIQLAIAPLAKSNFLKDDLHIHGITGSTGAGKSLAETSHFSWRTNNVSLYKAFMHQHLEEVKETITHLQKDFNSEVNFIPIRGDFARGILVSVYMKSSISEKDLLTLYKDYYQNASFVYVSPTQVDLKLVVNTNNCLIQVQKINGKVLITLVLDNLLKGAAGQAIQNMNLLFGLEETSGLKLKASYF